MILASVNSCIHHMYCHLLLGLTNQPGREDLNKPHWYTVANHSAPKSQMKYHFILKTVLGNFCCWMISFCESSHQELSQRHGHPARYSRCPPEEEKNVWYQITDLILVGMSGLICPTRNFIHGNEIEHFLQKSPQCDCPRNEDFWQVRLKECCLCT